MDMKKPRPEQAAAFRALLPDDPRVQRTAMFGLPHGKVGDYMFAGCLDRGTTVRLPPGEQAALIAEGAAVFEPMKGRPMRDWLLLPPSFAGERLAQVVLRAFELTAALPPKKAAAKKPAAKKSPAEKTALPPKRTAAKKAAAKKTAAKKSPAKKKTKR